MAQTVNIRRDVTDAFYRYKMEKIQTKVEGKGNGIKTVIPNLSSIATSLARPGSYIIKYFGFELGAQTNIDPVDDRWIINGSHEPGKLQDLLDGFIAKYVLCKKCDNPETVVQIKDDRILLDCKACGRRTGADLRLKLSGFIIKNQPQTKKAAKRDKSERKAARKAKNQAQNGNHKDMADDDRSENGSTGSTGSSDGKKDDAASDEDAARKPEDTARKLENTARKPNTETDATPQMPPIKAADADDDKWAVDMSEEAVKARQRALPDELNQKLFLNGEDEDDEGDGGSNVYDKFGDWIQEQADQKGGVDNVDSLEIYVKAKELSIEAKHRTPGVLVQILFEEENILTQIRARAGMLKQVITSDRHQRAFLGGTERFLAGCYKENPAILEKVVKILQLYYQLDLVTEEMFNKWGEKASKKYVEASMNKKIRKAAEPFLTWLAEAEEEESDEE